jgi:phosphatidate cytidylyltransferase
MMSDNLAVSETERRAGRGLSENLRSRLVWGTALAAVALALTYAGPIPFALFVLVVALFVSWEWGRMVRGVSADVAFFVQAIAVAAAVALTTAGYAALAVAVIVTAAIILIPLVFGRGARLSALGAFYVGLPSISLIWLRQDAHYGLLAALLIFAVVWSSDIAAYAAGRAIGGPKLWPRISPNKTWAGLLGGATACVIAGAVFAGLIDASPLRLGLIALGLSLIAQAGDLGESALKRLFGFKDASSLIPGHGGFMDRMDSIVAVAVAAGMIAFAINPHAPAQALLFGV